MIYFILSILFIIIVLIIYFIIQIKKIKMPTHSKMQKVSDDKIMKDLKMLQKQLLIIDDPKLRIQIIKKIEIITSIYN